MKRIFGIFTLLLFIGCSTNQQKYIVVEGKASVNVPIDYLTINISIKSSKPTLSESEKANREIVLKMFRIFKDFGISDSDFVTTKSGVTSDYLYNERKESLKVIYDGKLVLRNPSLYDELFRKIIALGDIDINFSGYGSDNIDKYIKIVNQNALKVAQDQAETLLSSTNQKLGRIIKLLKDGRDPYSDYDDIETILKRNNSDRVSLNCEIIDIPDQSTFRREYYTIWSSMTVIFEIK